MNAFVHHVAAEQTLAGGIWRSGMERAERGDQWMQSFPEDNGDAKRSKDVIAAVSFPPKPLQWLQIACVSKADVLQVEDVSEKKLPSRGLRVLCVRICKLTTATQFFGI